MNNFEFYSRIANVEKRATDEYTRALEIVNKVDECKTIAQIKGLLQTELGIMESVNNKKIGDLGYITTTDTDDCFKVNIMYSNKVHINIFPKLKEEEITVE